MNPLQETQEALMELYCKELKLSGVRQIYQEAARQTTRTGQSPIDFLRTCLAHEIGTRRAHQLQRRLKQARFPWRKSLGDFDFTSIPKLSKEKIMALADGEFIRHKENILCIGNPGTGKTHIGIALGLTAIESGYRVGFIKTVDLVQELLLAEKEYRLPRYLKSWHKMDLVILDELGYISLGPGGPLLFQFCAERYERGSVLITTNLDFSRWGEVFGDVTLTAALLDRLTHRSHVFIFDSESYRFRESQKR